MATGEYYGFDNLKSTNNLVKLDEIVRLFLNYADPSMKANINDITSSWNFYEYLYDAFESFKLHFNNYTIGIKQEDLSKKIQFLTGYISNITSQFYDYDSSTANDYLNKMGIDIDFFFNNTDELLSNKDKNGNWAIYSYIDNVNDGVDYYILDLHRSFFSLISEHFVNLLKVFLSSFIIQENVQKSRIVHLNKNDNDSLIDSFNIDDLYAKFLNSLKEYSVCDGDPITTDLVVLYDKLNELLNSLIRKLSLSSSDGKINQYINVCISSIKDLDFFKCEEYINVITEYNQHIFKDKSLADAMLEIRLAKGEIDYNVFPYIISKLHSLDFFILDIDDDENIKEVIFNNIISDYWHLQIYICHHFATKAINELSKLASDNENNQQNLKKGSNTESDGTSTLVKNFSDFDKTLFEGKVIHKHKSTFFEILENVHKSNIIDGKKNQAAAIALVLYEHDNPEMIINCPAFSKFSKLLSSFFKIEASTFKPNDVRKLAEDLKGKYSFLDKPNEGKIRK